MPLFPKRHCDRTQVTCADGTGADSEAAEGGYGWIFVEAMAAAAVVYLVGFTGYNSHGRVCH